MLNKTLDKFRLAQDVCILDRDAEGKKGNWGLSASSDYYNIAAATRRTILGYLRLYQMSQKYCTLVKLTLQTNKTMNSSKGNGNCQMGNFTRIALSPPESVHPNWQKYA